MARLAKTHDKASALTVLAHTLTCAIYVIWEPDTAVELDTFPPTYQSSADEPDVSRHAYGMRLNPAF